MADPLAKAASASPRLLIVGGAGFVGASLAQRFAGDGWDVTAFDNLRRRGGELNLPVLRDKGISFVHGDIRSPGDLADLEGAFDLMIEASAEPSVHAGMAGKGLRYLLDTNLVGALNCLEFARKRCGGMIFLSTSRVYSVSALRGIRLREEDTRLVPCESGQCPGMSAAGIATTFPTVGAGARSFYGATKLAAELFIEEYAAALNFPALINRCGVIAGEGQFGRTDQGVFTLWVARHAFGGQLRYTGFGGQGKQVRDLLHPDDLFELLRLQHGALSDHAGDVFNVGGGPEGSVSLLEYSRLCVEATGNCIDIASDPETAAVDIPYYVTDNSLVRRTFGWQPRIPPARIAGRIARWLTANADALRPLF